MAGDEIVVDFDVSTQSLDALKAAAYRFAGVAACRIDKKGNRFVCLLGPTGVHKGDELRRQFIYLVTDENLREAMLVRTAPVRNLILSLAFGSLATENSDKE